MSLDLRARVREELERLKREGLYISPKVLEAPQEPVTRVEGREVVNLASNNYLGFANHPYLKEKARQYLEKWGAGSGAVRTIAGTFTYHVELEEALARFKGTESALVLQSGFTANQGVLGALLKEGDVVFSDELNHASIIDGIRLCKARRYRYANNDMADLEGQLKLARDEGARFVMIATDGVFSMDGTLAKLAEISKLAEKYDAMVMVDDCHATGFIGPEGAGTPAHAGVDVDILTGTLGKALGGAIGGYIAGPQPVIDLLRQRARPYLFSNSLPPSIVAAGITALDLVRQGDALRAQLFENTAYWRAGLKRLGFDLLPGEHPIVPVMLGEAQLAQDMAARLFEEGVYVSGFFFPVVPRGQARIRTQMNAALTRDDLDRALVAFEVAGKVCGVIQ